MYFWPERGITPGHRRRRVALPVRLQDFSTSPAHYQKKAKVKVSKLYNKIANIRKDLLHKSSNHLAKTTPSVRRGLVYQEYVKSRRGSQEDDGTDVRFQ